MNSCWKCPNSCRELSFIFEEKLSKKKKIDRILTSFQRHLKSTYQKKLIKTIYETILYYKNV